MSAIALRTEGVYNIPDIGKFPSVTTILKDLEEYGIDGGPFAIGQNYVAAEATKIIEQIYLDGTYLRPAGVQVVDGKVEFVSEPVQIEQWHQSGNLKKHLQKVGYRDLNRAADRGTAVHHYASALANGFAPDWEEFLHQLDGLWFSEETEALVDTLKEWWLQVKPEVHASEVTGYNETYGYAGTLDLVATINGEVYLIDFKTSKNWRQSHLMQLAAYLNFEKWLTQAGPVDPIQIPGMKCLVVLIAPGEVNVYQPQDPEKWFVMFRKLLDIKNGWSQRGQCQRLKELEYSAF